MGLYGVEALRECLSLRPLRSLGQGQEPEAPGLQPRGEPVLKSSEGGWVYNQAGLPEEAIRSFERAIRMSPVDLALYSMLTGIGQALIELGRFDEAVVVLKKALRQNHYVATYHCLASAFAHLGRDAAARDAVARVLEIDPAFTISALIARADGQMRSC